MNPTALSMLIKLLTALICSRCRTKAEADRLMQMLKEFEEAAKLP